MIKKYLIILTNVHVIPGVSCVETYRNQCSGRLVMVVGNMSPLDITGTFHCMYCNMVCCHDSR